MILIIDNYDSFVFNLARYVSELGYARTVIRNDKISLAEINHLSPSHIILSPGPGKPEDAGICISLIREFFSSIPILGVCLGHQAIGKAFGGLVQKAKQPMHGKKSRVCHDARNIFHGIPNPFFAGRYHSLIVSEATIPQELIVTAWSEEQEIMAVQHIQFPVFGVQFHPESILTEYGHQLLRNFLTYKCLGTIKRAKKSPAFHLP